MQKNKPSPEEEEKELNNKRRHTKEENIKSGFQKPKSHSVPSKGKKRYR